MPRRWTAGFGPAAALLALLTVAGLLRPLLPIDETRYAGVAWEMWSRGDFLVPFHNGRPYSHKPPLLFWLIHAGWAVFGVNSWWPRLISPLFAAGTLALAVALARRLWPQRDAVARMVPLVLLSAGLFSYFASALMFDVMLSFFVALALLGLVVASEGAGRGFAMLAVGLGGALLAKGPAALVHVLPLALTVRWWRPPGRGFGARRWALGVLLALLAGAAAILAWALPAGLAGGPDYRAAIFWGQTAGRMADSFSHAAPWYAYLVALPLLLAPWLLWPRWWPRWGPRWGPQQARAPWADRGLRFVLIGALAALALFSMFSGKRFHYLLPEFTLFALLVARLLDEPLQRRGGRWVPGATVLVVGLAVVGAAPWLGRRLGGLADTWALALAGAAVAACGAWLLRRPVADALTDVRRIATATLLSVAALMLGADFAMREPYDVDEVAALLSRYEQEGRPVAFEGTYHGQWTLAGRLLRPLRELDAGAGASWLDANPRGRVLVVYRRAEDLPGGPVVVHSRRWRGAQLAVLAADTK